MTFSFCLRGFLPILTYSCSFLALPSQGLYLVGFRSGWNLSPSAAGLQTADNPDSSFLDPDWPCYFIPTFSRWVFLLGGTFCRREGLKSKVDHQTISVGMPFTVGVLTGPSLPLLLFIWGGILQKGGYYKRFSFSFQSQFRAVGMPFCPSLCSYCFLAYPGSFGDSGQ